MLLRQRGSSVSAFRESLEKADDANDKLLNDYMNFKTTFQEKRGINLLFLYENNGKILTTDPDNFKRTFG